MRERHAASMIFLVILVISVFLGMGAFLLIPVDTHTAIVKSKTAVEPYAIVQLDEDTRVYNFRGVRWGKDGTCLNFVSSHQDVVVEADDSVIFERHGVKTIFGRTPGYSWEYIEIPTDTKRVTVTLTACYPEVRNTKMEFYQGFTTDLFDDIFKQEGFTAIISVLTLCFGVLMTGYGAVAYKQSNIGRSMFFLGVFAILLSLWSCTENGIIAILIRNRAASSFVSYNCLALLGTAFVLFLHSYLQTEDKYLHRIILTYNMSNVVIVFLLQAFGIIDMKQVLITTHISLLFSFFYLPFSIVHKLKKNGMSQRVMVALASLCTMLPPLAYSMWVYYSGAHNVADYGDLFFFIFIAIYAINVSLSLKKDLDAGREAAIYRELAEKDLLTGCYNRNAFRNDCADCDDLRDILVVVCDLNNLKKCNDTLGHACGDKYLTDSSRVLKNIFSRYGKVYRIGGDEFCIIIHHCYEMRIHGLIANMREEEDDYNAQATDIRMEIACGYAEYDPSLDSKMEDIVTRADANMYENKKALKKQPH